MNKYKKLAMAVVSVVMASTMALSFTACKDDDDKKNPDPGPGPIIPDPDVPTIQKPNLPSDLTPKTDANDNLIYADNTALSTAIGYQDSKTGIKFDSKLMDNLKAYTKSESSTGINIYGTNYNLNNLKPAWKTLTDELKITVNDTFSGVKSEKQMEAITSSENKFAGYQVFTASASHINEQGIAGNLLNIKDYLYYMPNYAAFLEANPLVRLSLTADQSGAMYMLPYFDGNDDIEKFVLLRKDFVETLLNGKSDEDLSTTITYADQGKAKGLTTTSTSVDSFMGKVEKDNYTVDVTDPSVLDTSAKKLWGNDTHILQKDSNGKDKLDTVKVTLNYKAALDAAKGNTPLGNAIKAAAGKDYGTESGNIVDMQNFAINESSGAVTGGQLLTILREYIKVAYQDASGNAFYTGEGKKLSDVFNSAYAAWDVDLYTALGRCYVTCGSLLGDQVKGTSDLYLLTGREWKPNRYNDTISMAGELYGVRGLESRYQYTYVDADGKLKDARTDAKTYEAIDKLSKLAKEGLYNGMGDKSNITNGWSTSSNEKNLGVQSLSLHDYVQTQTANAGFAAEKAPGSDPYNLTPVLTPVSRWDTTGNGQKDTVMRFTESWRGVKNTGWCISKAGVQGNADKLAAALKLVDYFFSNDGQILMTYGPQASADDNGTVADLTNENGGFWYGTEVTNAPAEATKTLGGQLVVTDEYKDRYFTYHNKVYTGTPYNGRMIPTLTKSNLAMFNASNLGNHSFTNHARYYIGSALPIGNKDQGFEYQCTAQCGIAGSQIVNIALNNGTVKHPVQQVPTYNTTNETNWYTLAPSLLPYASRYSTAITVAPYSLITGLGSSTSSNLFIASSSEGANNLMIDIATYGLGSNRPIKAYSGDNIPDTAQGVVDYLNTLGHENGGNVDEIMTTFAKVMDDAWKRAIDAYNK